MQEKTLRPYFRIIGDVHLSNKQMMDKYVALANGAEYSLQVGDMAFDYDFLNVLDVSRHRFFGGNHENYEQIYKTPYSLGDFGVYSIPNFNKLFFVRGGFSIDHKYRQKFGTIANGRTWWPEEELSYAQCTEALEAYKLAKPEILVSHECPIQIVQHITNPTFLLNFGYDDPIIKTKTNQMLQAMTEFHMPKFHIFGHYHRDADFLADVDGNILTEEQSKTTPHTRYICLGIGSVIDMEPMN